MSAATPRRATALTRCVLLAFLATIITTGPASASPAPASTTEKAGSIGLRLLDAPANARNDPRALMYIVDHLAPGSVISRRIEVSNTTLSTAHVALYSAAASIADGRFLDAEGHTANDVSAWTSLNTDAIDIPAGESSTATVTIHVPNDAAPGEQYGVVWAEARSATADGQGVVQVSRVGIRLYLSIGTGGPPAANFTIDSLISERSADGQPSVIATVHNVGGRALDINGTLRLADGPGGLSAGPFPATLGVTLGIGGTESITIVLDKQIPAGPWEAQIHLQSGLVERSASAAIHFPDAGGRSSSTDADATSPEASWWQDPKTLLAVFVFTALSLGIISMTYRWRRLARRIRTI